MNNKKRNILIVSIIALIITLIGSTYAFFLYSKTLKAFTLTSGDIKAEFLKGDNTINLTYAYPISDNFAKDNLSKLGYVDFTVKGNSSAPKELVTYEIYLEEDSRNTLDSSFIKVYLTDDTNKEIVSPTSYNSLSKTTYPNSSNGNLIYSQSKSNTFEDKYRIYVWIDESYTQNTTNQTFSFKVNLYAYNDVEKPSATDSLKEKVVTNVTDTCTSFTEKGGLVAINTEGKLYQGSDGEEIREYRYVGPDVDNYIYFNCEDNAEPSADTCEVWRILGIFKDEEGQEHIKIVRNNVLPRDMYPVTFEANGTTYKIQSTDSSGDYVYWNYKSDGTYNNDWATAGLQYWLNAGSDKDTKTASDGYMSYLSESAKSMIEKTKYYLGNFNYSKDTITNYTYERGNTTCSGSCSGGDVWEGNQATWNGNENGNIALMYPSDVRYASNSCSWTMNLNSSNANSKASWLYQTANHSGYEWLLSPSSYDSNSAAYWSTSGAITDCSVSGSDLGARPVLNLKSQARIEAGEGSGTSPFVVKLSN